MFEKKMLTFFRKNFGNKENGLELKTGELMNLISRHKKLRLPDSVLEQTQNIIVYLLKELIELIGNEIVAEQELLNKLEPTMIRSQSLKTGIEKIERKIVRYKKAIKIYEGERSEIRQSKNDDNPIQAELRGRLNQGILNIIYQIKYLIENGQIKDSVEEITELFSSWDHKQLEKILKKHEINRKEELLGLVSRSQAKIDRIEIQLKLLNIVDRYTNRAK